jgi:hypothetical protein
LERLKLRQICQTVKDFDTSKHPRSINVRPAGVSALIKNQVI